MSIFNPHLNTYILDGNTPVVEHNFKKWVTWLGTTDRYVGYTLLGDLAVSTVFVGVSIVHKSVNEPSYMFETMVFTTDGTYDSVPDWFAKYRTWGEAEAGHEKICEMVKDRLAEDNIPW